MRRRRSPEQITAIDPKGASTNESTVIGSSPAPFQSNHRVPRPPIRRTRLTLTITSRDFLQSLLASDLPTVTRPRRVNAISIAIKIPLRTRPRLYVSNIVAFRRVRYILTKSCPSTPPLPRFRRRTSCRTIADYRSSLAALTRGISASRTMSLLTQSNFSPRGVHRVLRLPSRT